MNRRSHCAEVRFDRPDETPLLNSKRQAGRLHPFAERQGTTHRQARQRKNEPYSGLTPFSPFAQTQSQANQAGKDCQLLELTPK
jgi:hypothetical protein